MKVAIVQSGDLDNRWDSPFHVARQNHQVMVDRLMKLPQEKFDQLWDYAPESTLAQRAVQRGITLGTKADLSDHPRLHKAVYLAVALHDETKLERDALELEAQADALRVRQKRIQKLLKD